MTRLFCIVVQFSLMLTVQVRADEALQSVSGETIAVRLTSANDATFSFATAMGSTTRSAHEFWKYGRFLEAKRGAPYVLLRDGSRLMAQLERLDERRAICSSSASPRLWQQVELRRESLAQVVFWSSWNRSVAERTERDRQAQPSELDRVWLMSGDVLTGNVIGIRADERPGDGALELELPAAKQRQQIPLSTINSVTFHNAKPDIKAGKHWTGWSDGSLLKLESLVVEETTSRLQLACGETIQLDSAAQPFPSRLLGVLPLSDDVVFLSDLETLGFKQVPLLGWGSSYGMDRALDGGLLRASGERFIKGLSVRPTSRLAYDIPQGCSHFAATVCSAGNAATSRGVACRVYLERGGAWQMAHELPRVRGADEPQPISIPLTDARRLALVVEGEDGANVGIEVYWLEARFLSSSP